MSKHASRILSRLWAGSFASLQDLEELEAEGLEVVVSVLPIGTQPCDQTATFIRGLLNGRDLRHRIFITSDYDTQLDPEQIFRTLDDPGPTLIHCNAGNNRSTMLAICYLLLHRLPVGKQLNVDDAIQMVMKARHQDLGKPPKLYPQMKVVVYHFAGWLAEMRKRHAQPIELGGDKFPTEASAAEQWRKKTGSFYKP